MLFQRLLHKFTGLEKSHNEATYTKQTHSIKNRTVLVTITEGIVTRYSGMSPLAICTTTGALLETSAA